MNKRAMVYLGVVLAAAALTLPSFGQYGGGGWMGRHGRADTRQSLDDQVKHLTKELNLSEDQQTKVKSILQDQQKQMSSLKQDSSLSPEDRRAKFEEIKKNASQQIRAVLNEEQQKKYDELQSKHGNWREHRKGSTRPSDLQ